MADGQLAEQAAAVIPRALKEGLVCLLERWVVLDFFFRQRVDAGRPYVRDVDAQLIANVDHVERAQDVGPHRLDLMVLTPVGIGRAARARGVYDPGRLVLGEFAGRGLAGGVGSAHWVPLPGNARLC